MAIYKHEYFLKDNIEKLCDNECKSSNFTSVRLWNNPEKIVEENLLGITAIHRGLVVLDDCNAILRRDYNNMTDKVKLISGGGTGNEPAFTGFVGPGMLTAAISGNIHAAPSADSILKVIEEIATDYNPGVLLIIQNHRGYRLNFALAKLRAKNKGVKAKMIVVEDDACSQSSEKTRGKQGLVGVLFLQKIAGAMAEEGKNLEDIYNTCNKIISNEKIASISLRIPRFLEECACQDDVTKRMKIDIGHGIHREQGFHRSCLSSAKDIAATVVNMMIKTADDGNANDSKRNFRAGNDIAVIVNNLGGCSQVESNIFMLEILKHLKLSSLSVKRIYTGHLMTSLDTRGFHVSLLNLSFDPKVIQYLDAPTSVPAWPRLLIPEMVEFIDTDDLTPNVPRKYCEELCIDIFPCVKPQGPEMEERTGQVFLIILMFACEALIACTNQLNIMDKEFGDGDCGTTLARGASAIKTAIKEKKLTGARPFVTFTQMSYIVEKAMGGLQGGLYSLFFDAVAKIFSTCEKSEDINAFTWLNALIAANKILSEYGKVSVGDRTMLDPLMAAQRKLTIMLNVNCHPICAFGEAVTAAEQSAMQTLYTQTSYDGMESKKCKIFTYPDPGAHAVGIWMRAVYEGVKLKLICMCQT